MNIQKNEMEILCKTLACSLPMFRAKLGWSQEELASRLDITRQTISAFESGSRKLPWAMFLSIMMLFYANPSTKGLLIALEILNDKLILFFNLSD